MQVQELALEDRDLRQDFVDSELSLHEESVELDADRMHLRQGQRAGLVTTRCFAHEIPLSSPGWPDEQALKAPSGIVQDGFTVTQRHGRDNLTLALTVTIVRRTAEKQGTR
jgi:hypothetical protein